MTNNNGFTIEELKEALDMLKAQGNTDEDILKVMYMWYVEDRIPLDTLEAIYAILGFEFTDDFKAMREDDKKTNGLSGIDLVAYRNRIVKNKDKEPHPTKRQTARNKKKSAKSSKCAGMTIEELNEGLEILRKEGYTDEDILKVSYALYQEDKLELSDLRTITESVGYEFTDEFESMSEEDKKTKGLEKIDD